MTAKEYYNSTRLVPTNNWTLEMVLNFAEEYSQLICNKKFSTASIDEAGIAAVKISETLEPKLTSQEQSFFIAGFQECIKWLSKPDSPTI